MRGFADRIRRRVLGLVYADPTFSELLSSSFLLVWSAMLAASAVLDGVPATFDSSPSYRHLAEVAAVLPLPAGWPREWSWSAACLAVGVLQAGGSLLECRATRRQSNFAACLLWGLVAGLLIKGNPSATGGLVYGLVAVANAFAFWQVRARDVRLVG